MLTFNSYSNPGKYILVRPAPILLGRMDPGLNGFQGSKSIVLLQNTLKMNNLFSQRIPIFNTLL